MEFFSNVERVQRVHTYVDGEETYDSSKIDWTTSNVTVYSNVQIALKVLIY